MMSSSPGTSLRVRTFYLAVVLCCQLTACGGDGFQRFLVSPESQVVREGDSVVLRCIIANQRGKVQWTKDGFALGFHREVPGYPRYSYTGDASRGQHHLTISSVSLSDAGEYQCQVGPTLSNPPIWAAANLTVVLPPSGISLVGQSDGSVVEVVAGASLTLRCRVPDARPPPRILWYLDERQLPADQVDSQVVRSVMPHRWSVRSRLTLQPRMQDDGGRVICRVLHPGLAGGGALATSITLSVLHPPGPPALSGLGEGDTLQAGERRNITCTCPGGNPRPSLIWYRAGRLLDDSYKSVVHDRNIHTINTLELLATEADDGVVLECQAVSDLLHLPLTTNVTLSVYYGPAAVRVSGPARAEEGQSIALRCETSPSSPPASLIWRVNGEEVVSPNVVVKRVPSGGWVTSSRLEQQVEGPWEDKAPRQLAVECEAEHQSLPHSPHHTLLITLVKPAGAPVLGGEVLQPVVAGSSAEVTCASPHSLPQTSIRIYHAGKIVPTRQEHTPAVTQARGSVRVDPPDNGSMVRCEVISPASTKPKITSSRLSVLFPPRELMGSLEPEVAAEGSHVMLMCLTSSSNPSANLTWTAQSSLPPVATITTSPAAFGGTSTRSEVSMVVQAEDHERRLTCEANNGLGSPLQKSFVLNVLHAPVWRERPSEQINVWEGMDVSITASATANPGPVRYWWRRGEETLVGAGGTLRLGSATKSMAGNYSISAYSQRGAINTSFFLNIQYGPDNVMAPDRVTVSEGDAVEVRCSASGNPLPSLTWVAGNQSVGSGVGVARLVLRSAQREDTGLYVCQASGNLSSRSQSVPTKLIITQPVSMSEDSGKVKGSWASLGGKGKLVCQVRAAPAPSFLWTTHEGMKILSSDKYRIHRPVEVDGLVTWSSVLEVFDVSPQDYQPYHCSATNPLGSGSTVLTLRPPSRPFPPTNLTVISVSNVSVVLGWSPNLAGSRPLGYTVKYYPTGTTTFEYEEVSDGSSTGVEVGGLTPEVEYSLTAQAKNNQGRSDYVTPPVTVTTLGGGEGVEGKEERHVTSFLLLVIIMSVFGLLVLNVAAILCFLRHRKRRNSSRGVHSIKATSATPLGNTTSNPDHHHHHNHNHHNQVLLTLSSLSRRKKKKSKDHTRQGSSKRASVIPLPSPSSQRHRMIHFGKFTKHAPVTNKSSSACIHNGRIPKPPAQQQNNKSTLHTAKGLSADSSKPPKHKKQVTRTPGPQESHSLLVAHNQEKIISSKPGEPQIEHDQLSQDQLSQSSHESTQTAIFCEDSIPVSPNCTELEGHLQILEEQTTQGSIDQLTEEMKQFFQSRATHYLRSGAGSSRSLDYIDLDHCPGMVTESKRVPDQQQSLRNAETLTSDETSTSSECQPSLDPGPLSHIQESSALYHQQEEIQIVPAPPKDEFQVYLPPATSPHHWPPPTSPTHIQQHRMHSVSPSRGRVGHKPPEPPAKPKQQRIVSHSPIMSGQKDGASASPPSVRHRRTPSQSPARAIHTSSPEIPVSVSHHIVSSPSSLRSSHHMRPPEPVVRSSHQLSSESPVRYSRVSRSESPEVIRRQYRTSSASPVRSVYNMNLSESPAKKTRRNSESLHRIADLLETQKSPIIKEMSGSVSSQLPVRSRHLLEESPTRDVQHERQSALPLRHREYHRAPAESPSGGQRYRLPSTPLTRSYLQKQTPSPGQPLQASPSRHQHPQPPVQPQIIHHSPASPAMHHSPLTHQNTKPQPISPKSSEAHLLSVELNTGTHSVSFSPAQSNAFHPPLTSTSSGRHLPPTPPRSKKPRPLPYMSSSQTTLGQHSSILQRSPITQQISPEEISTSFVSQETHKNEDKHASASISKSVSGTIDHESRIKFREMVKGFPGSPSTVRRKDVRQGSFPIEKSERGQSPKNVKTVVSQFASANSPIATSSPLTNRRRTRFPDDFLWQSTSGKL
ncbi:nephrin-like isoform X2 [Portunus trituberculatus]|uniref:nephrin-like isoform X2 n=1 Tax=Portunus trituberculatus TaxID=210409 RepID=UPI001E1CE7D1|nr:nephrin-like isoform X2 [Portunus trituberculatus]